MRTTLTLITLALSAPYALSQTSTAPPAPLSGAVSWAHTAPAEEGWLGVSISPADNGVVVDEVRAGSPAERAGLRAGDVLLEFDGRQVGDPTAFVELVRAHAAGDTVYVSFARGENDLLERIVTLSSRSAANAPVAVPAPALPDALLLPVAPTAPSQVRTRARAGAPGTAEGRGWLGVSLGIEDGRVSILNVMDDSPAEAGGLRAGDRVLALNREAVSDLAGLVELVRSQTPGDRVGLLIAREGREVRLVLELGERPEDAARMPAGLPGAHANWLGQLDQMLARDAELRHAEHEEEGHSARETARRFREARRGLGGELVALLREHDSQALEELSEIAEENREERLEAFQEFRERLSEIEDERRARLHDWRRRLADRGLADAWRVDRGRQKAADPADVEALRREIEELRDHVRRLRHESGER